jgi:predicted nucleotidyltransferase
LNSQRQYDGIGEKMRTNLSHYIDKVSELCTAYGVTRLELFGSATRSDFDPGSSDMGFLVDFSDTHPLGDFDRYFGLKEALEQLFQRSVDLVERRAIKNPYFRQAIERSRVVVYGTGSQETD